MRASLLTLLCACSQVIEPGDTGAAATLPAPVAGDIDASPLYAGEIAGEFSAVEGCEAPTARVVTSEEAFRALVDDELAGCDGRCSGQGIDWATEAALVTWTGCTDQCARSLLLDGGKISEDGSVFASYQLLDTRGWACGGQVTRAYSVETLPLAAYTDAEATMERVEAADTGAAW